MRISLRKIAVALGVAGSLALAGAVAAMTVQPVAVDMKMIGREMSAPVRVENNGPTPLPVEIRIVETDMTEDTVRASDRVSDDIIAFPPQALIPPGETQVFRLQWVGDPESATSKHYYAEVSQLPVELPAGQSAIQILYNFQIMVNVASAVASPPKLSVTKAEIATNDAGKPVAAFTVNNSGKNYGYLSSNQVTLVHKGPNGDELMRRVLTGNDVQQTIGFGLVGPEKTRRFVSPIELASAEGTLQVILADPAKR